MKYEQTRRVLGTGALTLALALTACGGGSDTAGSSGGGNGGLCDLADTAAVAGAGGVSTVEAKSVASGCNFDGPLATSIVTTDRVLQITLVEGDGATKFGATTDELSIGSDGSALRENDQGWFSYEAVVGDQRLNVSNGTNPDDVPYDSAELRTLAQAALNDWIASAS